MAAKADLVAKRNELEALNKKIAKVREECKVADGDFDLMKSSELSGDLQARISDMRTMKTKQDALGAEVDTLVIVVKGLEEPGDEEPGRKGFSHPEEKGGVRKTLGERLTESKEFKSYLAGGADSKFLRKHFDDVNLKTLMSLTAGFAPQAIRTGEVEMLPSEAVNLFDLIPKGQTNQTAYAYMEETTRTEAAAERVEGSGAYAESAFAFTARSATVEDIGHFIPITRAQLDDVPQIQGIVDQEMRAGIRERLDYQLINGSGSTPVLQGLLAKVGINVKDATGETPLDALYKGIMLCQKNGFAEPNLVVVNGEDWSPIQLMKTDVGQYIWGHPADIGPMRVWGRRLVSTFRIAKGSACLGDFSKMTYAERTGITVEISDSHDTYFIYNKLAIRAWTRGVFVWKRPLAFCKVTNLAT